MKYQQLVFCQRNGSSNSYPGRADWLQYRINLVTRVPANFQQKTNIALNDRLDPKIVLVFSACNHYTKWCLLCVVSFFLLEIYSIMETQY